MCKKCKKEDRRKRFKIVEEIQVGLKSFQSQIQELKKELDDLRTRQMFEGLPTKEEDDVWSKKQAERRKKQIEAEYETILPMVEGLVYKMMANIFEKVKEFQTIEAEMLKHA